jgi:hypothetical protein
MEEPTDPEYRRELLFGWIAIAALALSITLALWSVKDG